MKVSPKAMIFQIPTTGVHQVIASVVVCGSLTVVLGGAPVAVFVVNLGTVVGGVGLDQPTNYFLF